MKYGEVIVVKRRWQARGVEYPKHRYRFRIDPVPFIFSFKRTFYCWYKRPKTTQEKKFYFACPEYVRNKRNAKCLPDPWDDKQRSDERTRKSWKNKKIKKQWMK